MRHVAIYKKIFVFAIQADFIFPEPSLTLGTRLSPFDRSEGLLIYEPSVIHEPLSKIFDTQLLISLFQLFTCLINLKKMESQA
ncbi:hypothetical protein M9Y10_039573 [Tritrichomonas musculus]|uniref:Uncharacterized protein n=1 Tax=Tritrichomonas musculus TaxID=1915356 RepID=A0ABR2KBK1_9EUKA